MPHQQCPSLQISLDPRTLPNRNSSLERIQHAPKPTPERDLVHLRQQRHRALELLNLPLQLRPTAKDNRVQPPDALDVMRRFPEELHVGDFFGDLGRDVWERRGPGKRARVHGGWVSEVVSPSAMESVDAVEEGLGEAEAGSQGEEIGVVDGVWL